MTAPPPLLALLATCWPIWFREVSLNSNEAVRDAAGRVALKRPTQRDRQGWGWPIYDLQPGVAKAAAVAVAWPPNREGAG